MNTYPQPGEAFGAYDIVRRIGRGGMGVVLAARHRALQRDVALKLLSVDLADAVEYRNRFAREAQTLARLDSPHVVRVYDTGEHDGWMYIATELVPDGDLAGLLRKEGALPVDEAISLICQVAEGLQAAHDAGILHRDIKPSNVLIRRRGDGTPQAVLCDFGISAVLDGEHTKTAGVIGTLGYMAPERHEGHDATVASDVYALGCLLYAVLAGRAPYEGTDVKVAMGHLYEPIPDLPSDRSCPAVLQESFAAALAKNPADRPGTAAEFRDGLASCVQVLLVSSRGQLSTETPPDSAELPVPDVTVVDPPTVAALATRSETSADTVSSAVRPPKVAEPASRPLDRATPEPGGNWIASHRKTMLAVLMLAVGSVFALAYVALGPRSDTVGPMAAPQRPAVEVTLEGDDLVWRITPASSNEDRETFEIQTRLPDGTPWFRSGTIISFPVADGISCLPFRVLRSSDGAVSGNVIACRS